ncbi:MAG: enoyl-CoA hydratase-related protein [Thermomicrobiales bacterium]
MTTGNDPGSDSVICEIADGVATITLNRPDRLNAIDAEMGALFDQLMVNVALDDTVRVVILTGAGRGFCAGADVARLDDLAAGGSGGYKRPAPGSPHPVFDALIDSPPAQRTRYAIPSALPKPVIAAVNGPCAGVGLALAAACDVRFANTDAFFTASFCRRGLTAEHGLAHSLASLIGRNGAGDLLLTGRRMYAEEALRVGLVSKVLPENELLAHVKDYAQDIALNVSPRSTRIIKRQLWHALDESFAEALMHAHREVLASMDSEDFQEGLAHFKERRPARFTGR